jgi:2-keto-4-pentenoate hydratase/2-oxohepta-3-ene-1,7-dioic acid hydratase in catechol pathway
VPRLASFSYNDQPGFGIVEGNFAFDISDHLSNTALRGLAHALTRYSIGEIISLARSSGRRLPLDALQFRPPIVDGEKILCVGLNFKAHAEEAGLPIPSRPALFVRFQSSLVGHGQPVMAPCNSPQFDFEGELAVVVGRAGRHISETDAMEYVLGFTIASDNSVRDWQKHTSQVTAGKNFCRSGAMGPWCVTRDEFDDACSFDIVTRLNGRIVQSGNTHDFIFSIPRIISYISSFAELLPGDVIMLGTPPGVGVGRQPQLWLKPDDILEVDIPGIGTLRNPVERESAPG